MHLVLESSPEKYGTQPTAASDLAGFLEANELDVMANPHAKWRAPESDKPLVIRVGSKPQRLSKDRARDAEWEAERKKEYAEWLEGQPEEFRKELKKYPLPVGGIERYRRERKEQFKREWFPPILPE